MNEVYAPLSLLGMLCTTQSITSQSIFASIEFAYTVLGIACLISLLLVKKTPKRSHVLSLKTAVRGALISIAVISWGWAAARLGAARSCIVEISVLVLLPLVYDQQQQSSKSNQLIKEAPVAAMCVASLLMLTFSSPSVLAIIVAGFSISGREIFQLFKDVSSVGMGALFSLLIGITLHLLVGAGPHVMTPSTSLPWTLASALLWVVPATMVPSVAEDKWFDYTQNKKNRVVFGLSCVTLITVIHRDVHLLSFFAALLLAVGFVLKKRTKPQSRSSLLPTTLRDAPTTVDDIDTSKKGGYGGRGTGVVESLLGPFLIQLTHRFSLGYVSYFFREAYQDKDSRKILQFLSLTLSFMFVELFVGMYTGSLGLISDAGHMFFDSAALFIGLFAAFASKWRPDNIYTFGYGRYETLAGFVNAVFLSFVAVFVLTESLERFSEPPEIRTEGLLLTSVLGLGVNGIGLVFFHEHAHSHGDGDDHGHSHGGHSHSKQTKAIPAAAKQLNHEHDEEHGHSHSGSSSHGHSHSGSSSHGHSHSGSSSHGHSHSGSSSHGHSHSAPSHGHSHSGSSSSHGHSHADGTTCSHSHGEHNGANTTNHHDNNDGDHSVGYPHHDEAPANENMHGVFLHVLADALGSVGVIISSLLIQYKGWHIADPICSFCISVLIFLSVLPLLKSTASSLMLRVPSEAERKFDSIVERCKRRPGVVRVAQAHLWRHSRDIIVASANIVVARKEDQDPVMSWLSACLKGEVGATDVTVQVCTENVSREL